MQHAYADNPSTAHEPLPGAFAIVPLEDLDETELGETAEIHRHKNFELLFLTEGAGICRADTEQHMLAPAHLCIIRPGSRHAVEFSGDAKGYRLCFAPDFFPVSMVHSLLLNTSPLSTGCHPVEVTGALAGEMLRMMRMMEREYKGAGHFKAEALRALLKVFFIYLSRLNDKQPPVHLSRKNQIVEYFLAMLDEKFTTLHRPAEYADALAVTPNYLNETLKTVSGFTTSHHIHQRVILEAKRLAVYGDHSMKQVAARLGFDDVSHFSRFFKKASGQGFTEFKQKTLIGVM